MTFCRGQYCWKFPLLVFLKLLVGKSLEIASAFPVSNSGISSIPYSYHASWGYFRKLFREGNYVEEKQAIDAAQSPHSHEEWCLQQLVRSSLAVTVLSRY